MSIARFEISEMPLPPQRYWPTAGAQKGTQCGNLTIGVGANLFSHSLDRQETYDERLSGRVISVKSSG
jgi:hypothetical protein